MLRLQLRFGLEDLYNPPTNPRATATWGAPGFLWPQLPQCTPWWTSFVMAHPVGNGRNTWWWFAALSFDGPKLGLKVQNFEKKSSIHHLDFDNAPLFFLLPFFGPGHHLIPFDHPPPLWWLIPGEGRLAADGDRAIDLNYLSHLAPWSSESPGGESCKITSFIPQIMEKM